MLYGKLLEEYQSPADPTKGNVALLSEIGICCVAWILGILFIHRCITYIPTLSKTPYEPLQLISIILPTVILILNSSACRDKVNLVMDRAFAKPAVVKSQPSAPQMQPMQPMQPMQASLPVIPSQSVETTFEPMQASFGGTAF
jgi:hypothetical protein